MMRNFQVTTANESNIAADGSAHLQSQLLQRLRQHFKFQACRGNILSQNKILKKAEYVTECQGPEFNWGRALPN